jgi:hypothetical protein
MSPFLLILFLFEGRISPGKDTNSLCKSASGCMSSLGKSRCSLPFAQGPTYAIRRNLHPLVGEGESGEVSLVSCAVSLECVTLCRFSGVSLQEYR